MESRRPQGRAAALLLALTVLMSVFALPNALGEENASTDPAAAEEVVPTETAEPEIPVEETPPAPVAEEPVVEEAVVVEEPADVVIPEPQSPAKQSTPKEDPVASVVTAQTSGAAKTLSSPMGGRGGGGGNRGTVKVDGTDFDNHPNNEPHVGCSFEIDYYNFAEGDTATYTFALQPPTGTATLVTDTVTFGPPGTNKLVASTGPIDLTAAIIASGEVAHAKGFHVKLTSVAPNGTKHKVFWVQGCAVPPPPDCATGYTLTTNVTPPGGGSISGAGTNPHAGGTSVDLTATPTDGTWTFTGWSGDGSGAVTRNVPFSGSDCSLEVTATFTQSTPDCATGYTLTTGVTPGGGSISGAGTNPHTQGTSVDLTATPTDATWTFTGWSGDGAGSTTRTVSFTGADCTLEVTANFVQTLPDCASGYTLTTLVSPAGGGTISGQGTSPHTEGTSVDLTATPSAATLRILGGGANGPWQFDGWSGDGVGDFSRHVEFTGADCELEVTALFSRAQIDDCPTGYDLTTAIDPPGLGAGTISGEGTAPHAGGSSVDLTATPGEGWTFTGWTGDGFGDTTRHVNFSGSDCTKEVTATFAEVLPKRPIERDPKDPKDPKDPEEPKEPAKRKPTVLSSRMPFTGSELITYLWLATLLIGLGSGSYAATRRRRQAVEGIEADD